MIGRREYVSFSLLGISNMEAKIDTGAYTSSLHCENIVVNYENSKPILYFTVAQSGPDGPVFKELKFESFTQKKIKNSFGEEEERYVIKTLVHICRKKIWAEISLSNRDKLRYPVLIGRKLLKGKFLVDINQLHTNGLSLDRALRQLIQKQDL